MLDKLINYVKSLGPFNIFLAIFILGLLYGGITLYMKYLGFSKFMNRTQIISVKAVPIKIATAQYTYRALSVIESRESINITSKVNGLVDYIHSKEGSNVDEGELLFSIISSDNVGLTKIYAPFTGSIGLSKKNLGDTVIKGELLSSLDDYSYMKLPLDLPERLLPYLSLKLKFNAMSDSLPNEKYKGTIEFVDTRIDTQTRTISAYALIDNRNLLLKPGLLMKVDINLEEKIDSILIPEEALLSINKKHFVYVVQNDTAKLQLVKIGIRDNAFIEIESGLKSSDKVIYMGQEKLKNGSKIKILE